MVPLSPDSHHHSPLKLSVSSLSSERMTLKHLVPLPNCTRESCTHEPSDDSPLPTAVSPQHLSVWKKLGDEGSACASKWSQKCGLHKTRCWSSFLLFTEKSNKILLTVRSSKYMVFDKKSMPIVACKEMRKSTALSEHLQWFSGEQQQLKEKQAGFLILKI